MRHVNTVLFGLLASSMLLAVGCNQADDAENTADTTLAETSAKNVSVSLTAKGSADVWVKLHVISKITGQVVSTHSSYIKGGATALLQLGLSADEYTFKADVYADAQLTVLLGSKSTDCSVDHDHSSELSLYVDASIQGSAGITFSSNHAPKIDKVSVQLNASLNVAALIKIDASDLDSGSKLHYFWSGFCLDGTVEGSSSLVISVDTALKALLKGGDHFITVIVQDELGATAHTSIDLGINLNVGLGLGLGLGSGTPSSTCSNTGADLSLDVDLAVCLEAHASCAAACNVAACASPNGAALLVSCLAQCGLELATCESDCGCGN